MKVYCVLFILTNALTASAAVGMAAPGAPQQQNTPSLTESETSTEPDWAAKQKEYTGTMSFVTTMKSRSTELRLTGTESSHSSKTK